jgi:hypothetical protein
MANSSSTVQQAGGNVIEYDTAAGNGFCIKCGTVEEEDTIVNEVAFGETSAGADGLFVGQGASEYRSTLRRVSSTMLTLGPV